VPAKDRVWCNQRADLFKHLPTQNLAFDGQPMPLVVVQQYAFPAELLLEHLILSPEVLDHNLLLPIDPAGQG